MGRLTFPKGSKRSSLCKNAEISKSNGTELNFRLKTVGY